MRARQRGRRWHAKRNRRQEVLLTTRSVECAHKAYEAGVERLVVAPDESDAFTSVPFAEVLVRSEDGLVRNTLGAKRMEWFECDSVQDVVHAVESASASRDSGDASCEEDRVIVLDCVGDETWTIIPAENVIAAAQRNDAIASVLATASSAEEAIVLLGALETGVDGVILETDVVQEVHVVLEWLKDRKNAEENHKQQRGSHAIEDEESGLLEASVTRADPVANLGDRVCVDVIERLDVGDALFVGSFAEGLFLVHSECIATEYIASRPFRFNAGAIHSYVLAPGNKTAYLSELKSGDEVLVFNTVTHRERSVTIGRLKIERRPMIRVEASVSERTFSVFLQNAETVRLLAPPGRTGASLPVTDLQKGNTILVRLLQGARHTGIAVDEAVFIEK